MGGGFPNFGFYRRKLLLFRQKYSEILENIENLDAWRMSLSDQMILDQSEVGLKEFKNSNQLANVGSITRLEKKLVARICVCAVLHLIERTSMLLVYQPTDKYLYDV